MRVVKKLIKLINPFDGLTTISVYLQILEAHKKYLLTVKPQVILKGISVAI